MFRKNTIKKSVIVLVALLMCATLLLTACNKSTVFKPVTAPAASQAEGNGGIAVRYGEYIYYVNGYQSSTAAKNGYTNEIRIGAIVRIKIADLERISGLNTLDDVAASEIAAEISGRRGVEDKKDVDAKAEMVIPNFYYNGNTTDTSLNGIYIFNDRIYITTPNNDLDANGNLLNSELVLTSYNLGGGDVQRHFVFKTNAPQLKLSQIGNDVWATYILDGTLFRFKVTSETVKEATEIQKEISSPNFTSEVDEDGNVVADYVYYLDKDGSICQYKVGDESANVLVKLETEKGHEGHSHSTSYTISSVNGSRVYYTTSEDTSLHVATAENPDTVVLYYVPSSYFGWGDGIVYTHPETIDGSTTLYHIIYVSSKDGSAQQLLVDPTQNGTSITLNKVVGNTLYYTKESVSYKMDLTNPSADPVSYAYSLSTAATGWSVPDVLSFEWKNGEDTVQITYVFTVSATGVSLVKFNPTRNNNYIEGTKSTSSNTNITLTAPIEK